MNVQNMYICCYYNKKFLHVIMIKMCTNVYINPMYMYMYNYHHNRCRRLIHYPATLRQRISQSYRRLWVLLWNPPHRRSNWSTGWVSSGRGVAYFVFVWGWGLFGCGLLRVCILRGRRFGVLFGFFLFLLLYLPHLWERERERERERWLLIQMSKKWKRKWSVIERRLNGHNQ